MAFAATELTGQHRAELSHDDLRRAFAHYPTGVAAVCACVDGRQLGLAVSTFSPVSLEPALISLCIRNDSATWPRLRRAPNIGISVLSESHRAAARALAGPEANRFSNLKVREREHGALLIDDVPLSLTATVVDDIMAGDHKVVVCRVNEVVVEPDKQPLIFHRSAMRRLQRA